jgi:hypothetical protein
MITYKTVATLLGNTSWKHLNDEINEAKLYNDNYLYVTVRPAPRSAGAGFGYMVRFSCKYEQDFVRIDEWLCGES